PLLHATVYRLLPQWTDQSPRIEQGPAIGRRERLVPPFVSQLPSRAAFGPRSPDLEASAAIRSEVDPFAVDGPARADVTGRLGRDRANLSSLGADDVDVAAAVGVGIERDARAVGRPARAADLGAWEIRDLQLIGAVGIGNPDVTRA